MCRPKITLSMTARNDTLRTVCGGSSLERRKCTCIDAQKVGRRQLHDYRKWTSIMLLHTLSWPWNWTNVMYIHPLLWPIKAPIEFILYLQLLVPTLTYLPLAVHGHRRKSRRWNEEVLSKNCVSSWTLTTSGFPKEKKAKGFLCNNM